MRPSSMQIAALAAALVPLSSAAARAERLSHSTTEARTVVFLKAAPDKVAKVLPPGWTVVPGSGATKDANLVLILVEGLAQSDADGKAAPYPDRYAVWGVSAKNERSGAVAFMVMGGAISPEQGAPGAYGVYRPATVAMTKTARADEAGAARIDESWDIATAGGDRLRLTASFARGLAVRARAEPRISSVAKPDFYRIYKADQVTEIIHSVPAGVSGARIGFSASGPLFSGLMDDGSEIVAVATVPAYQRQIYLPD